MFKVNSHKRWIIRLLYLLPCPPHKLRTSGIVCTLSPHIFWALKLCLSHPLPFEKCLHGTDFSITSHCFFKVLFNCPVRSPSTLISQNFYFLCSSLACIRYGLLFIFVYNILGVKLLKAKYILLFLCFIQYNEHFLRDNNDFYYWLMKRNWGITSFQCPDFS